MANRQLSTEELDKIKELNNKLGQLKMQLAEVILNEGRIQSAKEQVMTEIDTCQKEFKDYGEELQKTHGENISINMESGEISELPPAKEGVANDNKGDS